MRLPEKWPQYKERRASFHVKNKKNKYKIRGWIYNERKWASVSFVPFPVRLSLSLSLSVCVLDIFRSFFLCVCVCKDAVRLFNRENMQMLYWFFSLFLFRNQIKRRFRLPPPICFFFAPPHHILFMCYQVWIWIVPFFLCFFKKKKNIIQTSSDWFKDRLICSLRRQLFSPVILPKKIITDLCWKMIFYWGCPGMATYFQFNYKLFFRLFENDVPRLIFSAGLEICGPSVRHTTYSHYDTTLLWLWQLWKTYFCLLGKHISPMGA